MKKNSQFLLTALLSCAATTSYSMEAYPKITKENSSKATDVLAALVATTMASVTPSLAPAASTHSAPATLATTPAAVAPSSASTTLPGLEAAPATTPADQKRGAEKLDPTPILSGLLAQAKQLLTTQNLSAQFPLTKAEITQLISQGQSALPHLAQDNEFTKIYMKDADALMAKLIALAPQAQSLLDRGAEFQVHAKTMPAATEFADNVGTTFVKCAAFQRKLQATQAFRLMEFLSPNHSSNPELSQGFADQAKADREAQEKRDKEFKKFMDELKAQTDQLNEHIKELHAMAKPAPKGNNASSK